jgi:hypothetical protein
MSNTTKLSNPSGKGGSAFAVAGRYGEVAPKPAGFLDASEGG